MNTIYLPDGTEVNVADTALVSDGYHSFGELYLHRCLLFAYMVSSYGALNGTGFKARKNDNGEEMAGWFIAGLETIDGQITYHLPDDMWDLVHAPVIERNARYDGHTSYDVAQRIRAILESRIWTAKA